MKITSFDKLRTFLLVLLWASVLAQEKQEFPEFPPDSEFDECDSKLNCQDCLTVGFCDWYQGGICSHNFAQIMDIAMYSLDQTDSIQDVCQRAATAAADDDICSSLRDCASCTEALLTDGVSTCNWFENYGFCNAGCNMLGCGETTCEVVAPPVIDGGGIIGTLPDGGGITVPPPPLSGVDTDEIICKSKTDSSSCTNTILSDPYSNCLWLDDEDTCGILTKTTLTDTGCKDYTTCQACLDSSSGCSWVPVFFYESNPCTEMSCDLVADPKCYSRQESKSAEEICAAETNEEVSGAAGGLGYYYKSTSSILLLLVLVAAGGSVVLLH